MIRRQILDCFFRKTFVKMCYYKSGFVRLPCKRSRLGRSQEDLNLSKASEFSLLRNSEHFETNDDFNENASTLGDCERTTKEFLFRTGFISDLAGSSFSHNCVMGFVMSINVNFVSLIFLIIPDYRRESGGRSMTPEESQMEDLAGIKVK